jgi:HSP20 family protein
MSKEKETKKQEEITKPNQAKESGPKTLSRRDPLAFLFAPSPFTFMRRFAEDMDRLFNDVGFMRGYSAPTFSLFEREAWPNLPELAQTLWSPQIEVVERNGQFIVRADLPGLNKEDVKVELTNDAITIKGERKLEEKEEREGYYRSERSYGSFYRQIPLPQGAVAENATATFRDGVLEISMQCSERKPTARRLEIQTGEEPTKTKAAVR